MKLFRVLLSAVAFTLAIGGAVAANNLAIITNIGYTISSDTPFATEEFDVCDLQKTSGIQCTIEIAPNQITGAYKKLSTNKLFR